MAKPQRPLPPEYFFYLLYHVVRQRDLVLGEVLEAMELSMPKWRILSILNRLGESSMGVVADFGAIDRTTLTRTMDQLVHAGLVQRKEHPEDRRQTLALLTAAGQAAYDAAVATATSFNAKALRGVETAEIEVLERILGKVVHNVIEDRAWAESILNFDRVTS